VSGATIAIAVPSVCLTAYLLCYQTQLKHSDTWWLRFVNYIFKEMMMVVVVSAMVVARIP